MEYAPILFKILRTAERIIEKNQEFLLELGKGFAFAARQKRISTETKEFYVDLVVKTHCA